MKKRVTYLLTVIMICAALFTGCAKKTSKDDGVNDNNVLPGNTDNMLEDNDVMYHFVNMHDNGKGIIEPVNYENEEYKGVFILRSALELDSYEEYLEYIEETPYIKAL